MAVAHVVSPEATREAVWDKNERNRLVRHLGRIDGGNGALEGLDGCAVDGIQLVRSGKKDAWPGLVAVIEDQSSSRGGAQLF